MLTSKQRAGLRTLANPLETIAQIGKGGITDAVVAQLDEALEARELIKVRVLESALLSAREACDALVKPLRAEPVQCIGTRFVLYRKNPKNPKIELAK